MVTESIVIILFAITLIICVAFHISIIIALLAGLVLFIGYAFLAGYSVKEIVQMCFKGISTVKNILITFLFIGTLTAVWRSSGCIPAIVCYVSGVINPKIFIMLSFLLCALVSFLTGTSFGTAATIGVICMSIARTMNASVFWMGGAILSGAYWGDRCSPVSTSALLVSTITKTDLYSNIRNMLRTAILPTILTCFLYLVVGFQVSVQNVQVGVTDMFQKEFQITVVCLLPAIVIFLFALCKVKVKKAMFASIVTAFVISILVQHQEVQDLFRFIVFGFQASDQSLASVINGGGLVSMIRVASIVCIASCYAGIFEKTGLLNPLQEIVVRLSEKSGQFVAIVIVSIVASMIACNQTLSIMLTQQLVSKWDIAPEKLALYLENSVVLIAALVPWSIAGSVPLATVGQSTVSMVAACFLYILPLCQIVFETCRRS